MTDFGTTGYITINPGGDDEEIISFTGFTVNTDGTVSIDTGIVRGLKGIYPYSTGGTAKDHSAGSIVVVSNNPQLYAAILAYIDGIAVAGAPDASLIAKGLVEIATSTEIDADTDTGSTGAIIAVSPDQLALSKYGTRLPSAAEKASLAGIVGLTGAYFPYAGRSLPTGYLWCDGSAVSRTTYADLFAVLCPSQTVTITIASPGVLTASNHGLVAGDKIHLTTTGGLPSGLAADTDYYVLSTDLTTHTFKISLVPGGTAVVTTGSQSGTHTLYKGNWGRGDGSTTFNLPDIRSVVPIGKASSAPTIALTFDDSLVSTGDDTITVPDKFFPAQGQTVVLSTTGTLPTGLSAGTYYVIRASATTIKLAANQANANAGTAIDITAASGGGVHTMTVTLSTHTVIGKRLGEEEHGLSDAEMPSHTHGVSNVMPTGSSSGYGGEQSSSPSTTATPTIGVTGSDSLHNNMIPSVVTNYIIKT